MQDSSVESNSPEVSFASFVVYKSKAAVSVKVIPPLFEASGPTSRSVTREGGLLLEFANASGQKVYDWARKGTFKLSAVECAELMLMNTVIGVTPATPTEFFHDPFMGGTNAGQISKKMKFTLTNDGKGLFVSLNVNEKGSQSSFSLPLTLAEFHILKRIADYSIPHFLGFDRVLANTNNGNNNVASSTYESTSGQQANNNNMANNQSPTQIPVYKNFFNGKKELMK